MHEASPWPNARDLSPAAPLPAKPDGYAAAAQKYRDVFVPVMHPGDDAQLAERQAWAAFMELAKQHSDDLRDHAAGRRAVGA